MSAGLSPILPTTLDPGFGQLKDHIIGLTGLAYYEDKNDALAERVTRRIKQSGTVDCSGYLDLLVSEPAGRRELDALIAELTIGETFFFRYPEQFEALRTTILPDCIERNGAERRLCIWSAGCATGAEPYSLAVLIHELLGPQLDSWDVTILATDINREFLALAKIGRFGGWALRSLSDSRRAELFDEDKGQWQLRNPYRTMVNFAYHNLISMTDGGFAPEGYFGFDIILCRNVLIYFDRETIQALLPRLSESLLPGGWLLVGSSEPNEDFDRVFTTVNAPGTTLYRKSPPASLLPTGIAKQPQPPHPVRLPRPLRSVRPPPARRPPPLPPAAVSNPPSLASIVDCANRGCWDEARRACDRSLAADPMNAVVHYYSALIHHHNAAPAEAEQSYRKAIYLDRNFAMAHFQLGAILAERADHAGARKALLNAQRVLEALPDVAGLPAGDGLTAGDLRKMVMLRLEGRARS
ncbi:MAG: CheR family methyltransferase [Rhodospirillaceae bacterium]